MASKKAAKNDVANADTAEILAAGILAAQNERIIKNREEHEAKFRPFKAKKKISDTKSLVDTVHKIAEWSGVGEMSSVQVEQVCEFIATGQLYFTDGKLFFELKHGVKRGDETKRTFEINEISDGEMEKAEMDAFNLGMLNVQGRRDEITAKEIRKIAALATGMEDEIIQRMNSRDVLAIFSLYMLFFLGR